MDFIPYSDMNNDTAGTENPVDMKQAPSESTTQTHSDQVLN